MFQRFFKYVLLFFSMIACFPQVKAQAYSATAKLDSASIKIGGQGKLQLKVFVPAEAIQQGKYVQWPDIRDTISSQVEIVEAGQVDTSLSSDKRTYYLTQNLTITSFDSGYWVIPPFRFLRDGDSSRYFETQALLLEVKTVEVDPTSEINDIKPVIQVPYSLLEALPYILAIAALLALAFFAYRYFSRKRKTEAPVAIEEKAPIPPYVLALQKLEAIKEQKPWQSGNVKEYHSALTEIVRIYLEDAFRINALEQTSDEILISCRSLPIKNASKMKLGQMLQLADLVKFAKTIPLPNENELAINNAIDFVKETIPQEEIINIKEDEHV